MAFNYDELYRDTPDTLGAPTQQFVDFYRVASEQGLHLKGLVVNLISKETDGQSANR